MLRSVSVLESVSGWVCAKPGRVAVAGQETGASGPAVDRAEASREHWSPTGLAGV